MSEPNSANSSSQIEKQHQKKQQTEEPAAPTQTLYPNYQAMFHPLIPFHPFMHQNMQQLQQQALLQQQQQQAVPQSQHLMFPHPHFQQMLMGYPPQPMPSYIQPQGMPQYYPVFFVPQSELQYQFLQQQQSQLSKQYPNQISVSESGRVGSAQQALNRSESSFMENMNDHSLIIPSIYALNAHDNMLKVVQPSEGDQEKFKLEYNQVSNQELSQDLKEGKIIADQSVKLENDQNESTPVSISNASSIVPAAAANISTTFSNGVDLEKLSHRQTKKTESVTHIAELNNNNNKVSQEIISLSGKRNLTASEFSSRDLFCTQKKQKISSDISEQQSKQFIRIYHGDSNSKEGIQMRNNSLVADSTKCPLNIDQLSKNKIINRDMSEVDSTTSYDTLRSKIQKQITSISEELQIILNKEKLIQEKIFRNRLQEAADKSRRSLFETDQLRDFMKQFLKFVKANIQSTGNRKKLSAFNGFKSDILSTTITQQRFLELVMNHEEFSEDFIAFIVEPLQTEFDQIEQNSKQQRIYKKVVDTYTANVIDDIQKLRIQPIIYRID